MLLSGWWICGTQHRAHTSKHIIICGDSLVSVMNRDTCLPSSWCGCSALVWTSASVVLSLFWWLKHSRQLYCEVKVINGAWTAWTAWLLVCPTCSTLTDGLSDSKHRADKQQKRRGGEDVNILLNLWENNFRHLSGSQLFFSQTRSSCLQRLWPAVTYQLAWPTSVWRANSWCLSASSENESTGQIFGALPRILIFIFTLIKIDFHASLYPHASSILWLSLWLLDLSSWERQR